MGISLSIVMVLGHSSFAQQPPEVIIDTESPRSDTSQPEDVIINPDPQERDSSSIPTPSSDTRFTCQVYNGQYTVMYHPQSQPGEAYPWAVPQQLGGGWTPQRRCEAISQRLEFYREDGLLEMRTRPEGIYEIVCVTTQAVPSCRIVLTVPPGKDAEIVRDRVFENLTVADTGEQTQGINTFTGNNSDILTQAGEWLNIDLSGLEGRNRPRSRNGIDLRPFLDAADGGTGTMLHRSVPHNSNNPRLNPDNFR
ncbi:MAG: COP23 domain-containing protein [Chroococcales cyanobacterium]